MAQTGYTPISIYYSATTTNVPTAGNLVAGELAINTADGKLFYKDSSGVVQTIATKATATLPTTTTGSGNVVLSTSPTLVTPALGTPSALVLTNASGLPSSALPAGSVLQVVSATKTDAFSTTSTTFVDVTGLSVSITPKFSTSKILVQISASSTGGRANVVTMYNQIVRNSTAIYNMGNGPSATPDNSSDQPTVISANYLDAPATTSATTYKMQIRGDGAIVGINRSAAASTVIGNSTITVMEIAQ
jgi:hypothetical protein